MAEWDSEPDPYTYTIVNVRGAKRRYEVRLDGVLLGQIESGTQSTDSIVAGTRMRRPGKGRPAFFIVGDRFRLPFDRRRDAAALVAGVAPTRLVDMADEIEAAITGGDDE